MEIRIKLKKIEKNTNEFNEIVIKRDVINELLISYLNHLLSLE